MLLVKINWMPILLKDAGLTPKSATLISALFPLGGVGAVLCGMLMDRFNANHVIALCYALTAVSVYAIGQAVGNVGLLVLVVFVAGVLMNTAQSSMPALAAAFYPTQGRGTVGAWMLVVGRFGGIAGSFLVAELTRRHFTFAGVFATLAVAGGAVLRRAADQAGRAAAWGGAADARQRGTARTLSGQPPQPVCAVVLRHGRDARATGYAHSPPHILAGFGDRRCGACCYSSASWSLTNWRRYARSAASRQR